MLRPTHLAVPSVLALLVVAGFAAPAAATTYVQVSDEHLVDRAAVIGTFEVVASDAAPTARLATDHHVRVERLLKGELGGGTVVVRLPGGEADGEALRFEGLPSFQPGDRVLLFLVPRRDGTWGIAHVLLGAFHSLDRPEGALYVRPHLSEARALDRRGERAAAENATARDSALFLDWIADRAAGRRRSADYWVRADVRALLRRFTVFRYDVTGNQMRWFNFDSGSSVVWRADENGAPGFADGGVAALQAGLAAWNGAPQTNIRLAYGGTAPPDIGFNRPRDFQNMVLFEDPNDEIDEEFDCLEGGVVAIGGPIFNTAQVLRHRNQNWHPIGEGVVIVNSGIACFLGGNTVRLAAVLGHELGHTLGFGHSCSNTNADLPPCAGNPVLDDALMRATVHNDGRGARLGSDDIAAARNHYGTGSANPPKAPNQLSAQLAGDDVKLSWSDRSPNEDGFRLYRRLGGGAFGMVAETGAGVTMFTDANLPTGNYDYEVRSFNGAGESGSSNRVAVVVEIVMPGTAQFADTAFYGGEESGEAVVTLERVGGSSGTLSTRLFTRDLSAAAPFDYGAKDVVVTWVTGDVAPKIVTLTIVDDFSVEDAELIELVLETAPPAGQSAMPLGTAAVAVADDDGAAGCTPGEQRLCLLAARFKVEVEWRNQRNGSRGPGRAVPGSDVSGYVWFFNQENIELVVKMLETLTGAHWVFYGALSDVEYWVTVTDTQTGERKLYRNAPGNICGLGDTAAFPVSPGLPVVEPVVAEAARGSASWLTATEPLISRDDCVGGPTALCLLGNRFRVEVAWRNHRNGKTGVGTAVPYSDQTGFFWFFDASNIELVVKSLDGQGNNGNFWFFYGALSDIEYTITVTDTATGAEQEYQNLAGNICGQGDNAAFPGD